MFSVRERFTEQSSRDGLPASCHDLLEGMLILVVHLQIMRFRTKRGEISRPVALEVCWNFAIAYCHDSH